MGKNMNTWAHNILWNNKEYIGYNKEQKHKSNKTQTSWLTCSEACLLMLSRSKEYIEWKTIQKKQNRKTSRRVCQDTNTERAQYKEKNIHKHGEMNRPCTLVAYLEKNTQDRQKDLPTNTHTHTHTHTHSKLQSSVCVCMCVCVCVWVCVCVCVCVRVCMCKA